MLTKIISFLPSWIKFIPIIVGLTLVGYLYYQNKSLQEDKQELSIELAEEQRRASLLSFQLENTFLRAERQAQRLQSLSRDSRVAQEENNRLNQLLEGYKGNEQIAIDNPEDIERRANDAIHNLMREYECSTGNIRSCPK
jgi:hypothetical protein